MSPITFSYIHPAVLDVYFHTLELNELGAVIDGYGGDDIPLPLHEKVQDAALLFAKAEQKALQVVGSRSILNEQLIHLQARRGIS
jgi:hypothetical protein